MSSGGGAGSGRDASVAGYDKTGPELGYSGPSTATGAMEAGVDPGLAHAVFGQGRQSFGDKSLDALDALAQHGLKNVFDRETVVRNIMSLGIKTLAGIHGGPLGAAATVAIDGLLDDTPKTDPLKNSGVSFDPTNTGITTNPNLGTDPDRVGFDVDDAFWGVNPLDLDNALAWNPAKVSPNILQNVEPSVEQMLDLFDNPPMTINVNQDLQEALGPGFSFESFNTNVDPYGQFSGENVVPLNAPKSPFGMFLSMPPPMTGPVIEMIDPVNTTPTVSPAGNAILDHIGIDQKYETPQEDIDALMDDVLGLDLPQIDQDVLGLDRAMVSTDPWGGSVTSSISHSDTEREYAERAAAERALYSQIANQITQAASQSSGRQAANAPEARPVVIPAGTQAANAPAPVRHDPIANLVRTVLSPKINQVNPAAVKAIKKGKKPDYTMMSNYQQDLVRNILNPPKPPVSSNYSSIANR